MKTATCRVCLKKGDMQSLFQERNSITLSAEIMSLAKVEITPEDGLPNTICRKCVKLLDVCTKFIRLCEESDVKLRAETLQLELRSKESETCKKYSSLLNVEQSPKTLTDNSNDYQSSNITLAIHNEYTTTNQNDKDKPRNQRTKKQQCTICGIFLSSRFRLQTHLRTHSGERPYSCGHCSKAFALKTGLKLHIRIHTGEKPLKCTECNVAFRHPSSLRSHMRIHSGETPYQCMLCQKSFHTASNLQYHLRKHTGEKNFECDSCGKAFINRGHLQQHLLLHSGDKPFMCSVCGLKLSRASHLRRHLLKLHNIIKIEPLIDHKPYKQIVGENQIINEDDQKFKNVKKVKLNLEVCCEKKKKTQKEL